MKKLLTYLVLSILITSCAALHNTPKSVNPNVTEKPNIVYSFVDQNGNFYPNNWRKTYGSPPPNAKKHEYSLMKIATEKGIQSELTNNETNFLTTLAKQANTKKRVIHNS